MRRHKGEVFVLLLCFLGIYARYSDNAEPEKCPERKESLVNRKCARRCVNDRDCLSQKKECECDGDCGLSCINKNIRCLPTPKDIAFGSVTVSPFNKFGALARYECKDGYTLEGLPARICQGDATWFGREPKCVVNHGHLQDKFRNCEAAPIAHNAMPNSSPGQLSFPQGTSLTYECLSGFTKHKDSVDRAWCVGGGVWVGPNMVCTTSGCSMPAGIDKGRVERIGQGLLSTQVRYHCFSGYFLVGNDVRKCREDGTWEGMKPSCVQVVCGPPPIVEHAKHDGSEGQARFSGNTILEYTCKFGYYREGNSKSAICDGIKGQWKGPDMSCVARDCGAPGNIDNGRLQDNGYRFSFPSRVMYYCDEGYEMKGAAYRDCMASGQWSGSLPECEPVHCSDLSPPLHGTMIGSGTAYGTNIRFVCNNGYKVVGSHERKCQADRTWSGKPAVCEEIDCGDPGPIWNGYVDGHRKTVGAVYFYRCRPHNKFQGTSFSTQCLETGEWSVPPPLCLGQCQIPEIINGSFSSARRGTWVDHETVIEPICFNGLVLNDSRPVMCDNGTWTMIPECVPAPCNSPPPRIKHGHRVFFDLAHGSRARYYCVAGRKLHGKDRYLRCKFGKWEGHRPKCEKNYCPHPGVLHNGEILKVGSVALYPFANYIKTIEHGNRLVYKCNRDHRLVGPHGAACINGRWSPKDKPRCIVSRHPIFNKLWRPLEERDKAKMYY